MKKQKPIKMFSITWDIREAKALIKRFGKEVAIGKMYECGLRHEYARDLINKILEIKL